MSGMETIALPADPLPEDRVRQAARLDSSSAELRQLARDPDLIVRATVALSRHCDAELDAILAMDEDERVRALLAARIARLLCTSDIATRHDGAEHVICTLRALASDEAVRVRAAIADELAQTMSAPQDLILQLAHDVSREVSDRVIRLSPMLRDSDLLSILACAPSPNVGISVANRERLSAAVADAIVDQADAPTIQALLGNHSACIREATLDALVGRAPHHIDWHAPLVRRPHLSCHAIRALSEFIAFDLLRVLAARKDVEPAELEVVRRRIVAQTTYDASGELQAAARLKSAGQLTEAALLASAREGDLKQLLAQLAVSSGMKLQQIERLLELRSAKALVSIVWQSGFSMSLAVVVQAVLAQFGPDTAISPAADGGFPLTRDEMTWQIELMNGAGS